MSDKKELEVRKYQIRISKPWSDQISFVIFPKINVAGYSGFGEPYYDLDDVLEACGIDFNKATQLVNQAILSYGAPKLGYCRQCRNSRPV